MRVLSAALAAAATALLVVGLLDDDGLPFVYLSILVGVAAAATQWRFSRG